MLYHQINFLIVDDVHPLLFDFFKQKGAYFSYQPAIQPSEAEKIIKDFSGLIIRSKFRVDKTFLEKAPLLKIIGRAGSGMDNIDVQEAQKKNIVLLNAPEGNRKAVAEHALGLLLGLLNKMPQSNREVKQKIWQREANRGTEVGSKTVGIIGYGHTGREFAKYLHCLGANVIAYDRKKGYGDTYAKEVTLEYLQEQADVISFHVSLNEDSRKMFSPLFLEKCEKPFWLLNTSRGEVVDLATIYEGLANGKILGVGLDVLENERLDALNAEQEAIFEKITQFPNVILSPHVAGWTVESYKKISEVLATKIADLIESYEIL